MSAIEWTDVTWNPTVGCTRVSPGCENCYAEKVAHRGMSPQHKGLTVLGKQGVRWNGEINLVPSALEKPFHWRKPRKVFVDSMSDLFHPGVPFEYIAIVFGVMAACPQHTFQVLTKRPARMVEFFEWLPQHFTAPRHVPSYVTQSLEELIASAQWVDWPLANVWLGVSVEDQQRADERIPLLLECPAAVRFLSCEPLLGPVEIGLAGTLPGYLTGSAYAPVSAWLHWVIVGGESGQGARLCDMEWLESIVDECTASGVPVFVKQLGARPGIFPGDPVTGYEGIAQMLNLRDGKGGDISEFPSRLQIRQFPDRD